VGIARHTASFTLWMATEGHFLQRMIRLDVINAEVFIG